MTIDGEVKNLLAIRQLIDARLRLLGYDDDDEQKDDNVKHQPTPSPKALYRSMQNKMARGKISARRSF